MPINQQGLNTLAPVPFGRGDTFRDDVVADMMHDPELQADGYISWALGANFGQQQDDGSRLYTSRDWETDFSLMSEADMRLARLALLHTGNNDNFGYNHQFYSDALATFFAGFREAHPEAGYEDGWSDRNPAIAGLVKHVQIRRQTLVDGVKQGKSRDEINESLGFVVVDSRVPEAVKNTAFMYLID